MFWREWNEAALAEARDHNVPLFVSVGYSSCHWCRVMGHESFRDEGVARRLNSDFVAIIVDREERPDLDRIYMNYVQAVTGRSGWPLSVWLTPDLKPFFGGTFFPRKPRDKQSGFCEVLDSVAAGWQQDRTKTEAEAERILHNLQEAHQTHPVGDALPDLTEPGGDAFESAYTYFFENHDAQFGGFGGAPKFPRPQTIGFLIRCAALQGLESAPGREALAMVTKSLEGMSRGAIHDHIGGGFHRYAGDDGWRVPNFEKMLYDQAQIAVNLVDAYQFSQDERFAGIASHLFAYVVRELRHPEGGFWAGQGADSASSSAAELSQPGAFYRWDYRELLELSGDAGEEITQLFGVLPEGNLPSSPHPSDDRQGLNVLYQAESIQAVARRQETDPAELATRLDRVLAKLRSDRLRRPAPSRDEKVVAAWNGLMIAGLARASTSEALALRDASEDHAALAESAASFLRQHLWEADSSTLYRVWHKGKRSGPGLAEDYASLVYGLLELYDATVSVEWLRWADELQSRMDELFWDERAGGYFQTRRTDASIVLHLKDDHDGGEPSANSLAATNQFRLAALLQDERRYSRGLKTLQAFRHVWEKTPWVMPTMLEAVEWSLSESRRVTIWGNPRHQDCQSMMAVARDRRGPRRVTVLIDPDNPDAWLVSKIPQPVETVLLPQATVCSRAGSSPPVTSATNLRLLLNP